MPSMSLADVKQRDWIRACRKLGLVVEVRHGKGSHVLVKHPHNGTKYTIQRGLHRILNTKIFGILRQWEFTDEQIYAALR